MQILVVIIATLHLHVHQVSDRTDLIPSHRSQFERNKILGWKINDAIRKLVQGHTAYYLANGLLVWINKTCVHTTWEGIIKHFLDRTSHNIIFTWSGKVILGLGFASPNITLPDQINMILVSVLSNKCMLLFPLLEYCILIGCSLQTKSDIKTSTTR